MCSGRNGEADVVRVNRAISDRLKGVCFFFFIAELSTISQT